MLLSHQTAAVRTPRGAIMLTVLVCLTVASILCGLMLRIGLAESRLLRDQEQELQAMWLAESALDRAVARRTLDAAYRGETWTISADELGGRAAAVVRISIEGATAETPGVTIKVQADYPADSDTRTRETRVKILDLKEMP